MPLMTHVGFKPNAAATAESLSSFHGREPLSSLERSDLSSRCPLSIARRQTSSRVSPSRFRYDRSSVLRAAAVAVASSVMAPTLGKRPQSGKEKNGAVAPKLATRLQGAET